MTGPTDPPEATPVARSNPEKPSDRQRPSRRTQMLYAATYAVELLDRVAAGEHIEPAELSQAANGLRHAATRLGSAKPPAGTSGRLPKRGRLTKAGRDVTLENLATVTAVVAAIAETEGQR